MSIRYFLWFTLLSFCLSGCGSNRFYDGSFNETVTHKGLRYRLGRGMPKDDVQSFKYFTQAAKAGDAFAENELAYLYAAGIGTKQNFTQALFWYRKAADHGLASAKYNLGLMYLHGIGTEKDKNRGIEWIEQAAKHGFAPAKTTLEKLGS